MVGLVGVILIMLASGQLPDDKVNAAEADDLRQRGTDVARAPLRRRRRHRAALRWPRRAARARGARGDARAERAGPPGRGRAGARHQAAPLPGLLRSGRRGHHRRARRPSAAREPRGHGDLQRPRLRPRRHAGLGHRHGRLRSAPPLVAGQRHRGGGHRLVGARRRHPAHDLADDDARRDRVLAHHVPDRRPRRHRPRRRDGVPRPQPHRRPLPRARPAPSRAGGPAPLRRHPPGRPHGGAPAPPALPGEPPAPALDPHRAGQAPQPRPAHLEARLAELPAVPAAPHRPDGPARRGAPACRSG